MIKQLLAIPALMAVVMSTSYAASKPLDTGLDTGASPAVNVAVVPEKPTVYEVSGKLYALIGEKLIEVPSAPEQSALSLSTDSKEGGDKSAAPSVAPAKKEDKPIVKKVEKEIRRFGKKAFGW